MNELFVSVKVDREERPDVDSLYMDAVDTLTGQGGWPMTVFLTPEGEPFLGGTYYPPEPRHGLPSFRGADRGLRRVPRASRRRLAPGVAIVEAVRHSAELPPSIDPLTESMLGEATRALRRQFDQDWAAGRRAEVPAGLDARVPPAHAHARDEDALPMVTQTLDAMAAGGMYDLSAAASTATRSTASGSSRTSKRCCTTTRSSRRRTSTPGRDGRRALSARERGDAGLHAS